MKHPLTWHIFCRVIDNYGDIGFCWRLARQLATQYSCRVTLWVDQLPVFRQICPAINPHLFDQELLGVRIRHWVNPFPDCSVGDVVIEAFGCELPAGYLAEMRVRQPIWINLEYLSAESWVPDYHLGNSPVNGQQKTFFFPGFVPHTGGLLRDSTVEHLRVSMGTVAAGERLLQRLGIKAGSVANDLQLSLFAYQNQTLPHLLSALATQPRVCHLLVPIDQALSGLNHWLTETLTAGASLRRGNLTLSGIPFTDLDTFDELLAMADINFVRGEDSFVRSQLLGKPFIWHIYPQEADAHLVKLEAFLDLYLDGANAQLASWLRRAHRQWNHPAATDSDVWTRLLELLPQWCEHAESWRNKLLVQDDLSANLVHFCTNQL